MKTFPKLKKKFALNNSYFKNRQPDAPADPFEVIDYFNQHGELPYTNGEITDEWFYDCFIEYQKRAGVQNSQFFTPTETAKEIAHTLYMYADEHDNILEPCCGFGQITAQLMARGFENVEAFDNDERMIDACIKLHGTKPVHFEVYDYTADDHCHTGRKYPFVVSNPPYEGKELTAFLEYTREMLEPDGYAVLLIPCGFLDKTRPAKLVQVLNDFAIIERKKMTEQFARTGSTAEIVVLRKI